MRFPALLLRELDERHNYLVLGAIAAIVVQILGLVTRRDVQIAAALLLAPLFAFGVAAILGGTIVWTELRQRRMTFYLSRPLTASQIWFAKLGAALVIAIVPGVAIALPLLRDLEYTRYVLAAVPLVPFVVIAAHVFVTVVRSRSWRVLLDVAAFTATVYGA